MGKKDALCKILAIVGTGLTWLPVVAPVTFSLVRLIDGRIFLFDYMMPAELFPVVLLGSALLIWAVLRAKSQRKLVIWSFVIAVGLLVGGLALADASGLASGAMEPAGILWVLVLMMLIGYDLAVVALGVGGVLLIRDLFKASRLRPGAA